MHTQKSPARQSAVLRIDAFADADLIAPFRRVLTLIGLLIALVGASAAFAQTASEAPRADPVESGRVQEVPTAPHEVTSEVCGTCHKEIYAEWKTSMHAQSSALSDPIHAALYKKVMGDPRTEGVTNKKGKYPVCLNCHAPNAALSKKTKLDAVASYDEGVSCIFCHTITGFKGTEKPDGKLQLGVQAYEISTSALQSPSGRNYTTMPASSDGAAFHPFPMVAGEQALVKTDKLCLGCHDQRNNSNGVPLCVTGAEIQHSGTDVSCQSCHMPTVPTEDGHASHTMLGGHDANVVRRGVYVDLKLNPQGDVVDAELKLTNRLPHNFPTGAPFRNVVIKVAAYDANGKELWRSPEADAFKEKSDMVLVYRLGDGQGNPSMPPPAKEALSDTRLTPHEQRVLNFSIPAAGVKKVRADLYYNLLWPNMVKQMTHLSKDLTAPKHIATAEALL